MVNQVNIFGCKNSPGRISRVIRLALLFCVLYAVNCSADISHQDAGSSGQGNEASQLAKLVMPMGIITLSLVAVTVFLSVFRRLNIRPMMKWHKRAGLAVLISGVIHLVLVLIAH